jgi:D-sedoheptulose 7-phosphate isomerase
MHLELETENYLTTLHAALERLDRAAVARLMGELMTAWCYERTVLLLGNGGSAATASHMVNDLNKIVVPGMPRFRALALTDNIPLLTAWANDAAYERVFAEQLRNYCREDDLVIAISCSGNSPNVIQGVHLAQQIGARVIALTGDSGGRLLTEAEFAVRAHAPSIGQQEDIHLVLDHLVTSTLRRWGEAVGQRMEQARRAFVWVPPALARSGSELREHWQRRAAAWLSAQGWQEILIPEHRPEADDSGKPASFGAAVQTATQATGDARTLLLVRADAPTCASPVALLRQHHAHAILDSSIGGTLAFWRVPAGDGQHGLHFDDRNRIGSSDGLQRLVSPWISAGIAVIEVAAICSLVEAQGLDETLAPTASLAELERAFYGSVLARRPPGWEPGCSLPDMTGSTE